MATGLKTKLYTALSDVLDITIKIKESWIGDVGGTFLDTIRMGAVNALGPLGEVYNFMKAIKGLSGDTKENISAAGAPVGGAISVPTKKKTRSGGFLGDDDTRVHPGLIIKPETPKKTTGSRNTANTMQSIPITVLFFMLLSS